MRKLSTFIMLCVMAVTALAQTPTRLNVTLKDGSVNSYELSTIDSLWFSSDESEEPVSDAKEYVIEISTVFKDNDVMRVMDGGNQVAEICLEYIKDANLPLIIVYPMTEEGKADLTRGWCANNTGTVVWDVETNTCQYTPGNSPLQERVYLRDGKFTLTPQGEPIATTQEGDFIIDKRGNEQRKYKTVKIGTQYWMAQNLNATRFRNGTAIPNITAANGNNWKSSTKPAYHVLFDDPELQDLYGVMYNGYTVESENGLAPSGWLIPEIADFQKLITYLGTESGLKMKSYDWNLSSNIENNNMSGFTADAAGFFFPAGDGDMGFGSDVYYWTKTIYEDQLVGEGLNFVRLNQATKTLFMGNESAHLRNQYGHYVRCVRK